jgi:hypothetical protein
MDANFRLLGKAYIVTVHWQKEYFNSEPSVISDLDEKVSPLNPKEPIRWKQSWSLCCIRLLRFGI